jgi:transaldolase
MQVKVPATRAGLQAAEDATAAGVNVNVTVCFTVPQALTFAADLAAADSDFMLPNPDMA